MPGKSSNLGQFWQELKRRRVIHVITVYATAAFVIIELVGNLTEPLNLPAKLPTIVIIILAVGFPLAIILSWLYDLTSEGVEKTKPLSEIPEGEKPAVPNAWKIATYVSFIVIMGLVVFNVMGRSNQIRPGDIQSLLILPFDNYTGDDQLDIVISGMHSSLIGDIGRISGFKVFSKTTSDVYKDADMTLSQIASELGVDAILEPAVMCYGESICFEVKMITPDEKQIWFAEYSESRSQIFNIHNNVTKQIAVEVKIELTPHEERLLAESRTADPEALDAYFKGRSCYEKTGKENFEMAREYFEMAIEIDPNWAPPYTGMSRAWGALVFFGYIPQNVAFPEMYKYLHKALELDPNSAISHFQRAQIAAWHEWDWETGEREFLRSLELNPNDALCRMFYAHLLMILRRTDEAVYQAQMGLELDPMRPLVLGLYGEVMISERDYQSAIEHFEKALSIDPDNKFAPGGLAYAYRATGDTLKWYEILKKDLWRTDEDYFASLDSIYHVHGYQGVIEEIIRVNEEVYSNGGHISFRNQAERYFAVGKSDKAMDYLDKAYERNDGLMAYTSTDVIDYPELKYNPRYIALLKKMNLPLPED